MLKFAGFFFGLKRLKKIVVYENYVRRKPSLTLFCPNSFVRIVLSE